MGKGLIVAGVILVALGLLWVLQGVGLVGGSFMSGQRQWLVIGILTDIVGALLLLWARVKRL